MTPANEDERAQVKALTAQGQLGTGEHVELAYVDQGYTGPDPVASAQTQGIELVVVKTPEATPPRPNAASFCCPNGGWSSAASPG
jgi:hypothetical protein